MCAWLKTSSFALNLKAFHIALESQKESVERTDQISVFVMFWCHSISVEWQGCEGNGIFRNESLRNCTVIRISKGDRQPQTCDFYKKGCVFLNSYFFHRLRTVYGYCSGSTKVNKLETIERKGVLWVENGWCDFVINPITSNVTIPLTQRSPRDQPKTL